MRDASLIRKRGPARSASIRLHDRHCCDEVLARPATTGAFSATCARARAACTRASAASASCGPARAARSCSRPTAARAASASTRSRRSRSTTSSPARRSCRSARPAATSPASSARTGTSRSRARSTRSPMRPPRRRSPTAAETLGCESVAFTYNDPVIFLEYAVDVADACRARGIKSVAVTAGYVCPGPRRDFFAHMDAANIDLKGFNEDFYRRMCGGPAPDGAGDVGVRRTRDRRLARDHEPPRSRATTTPTTELDAMTRWIVERLGPDVPMHFTAFHPDYKMLDVPPTPPETLHRAPRDRPRTTASATPTRATSSTRRGKARAATPAERCSSSATGIASARTASVTAAAQTARPCSGRLPGAPPVAGALAACPSASPRSLRPERGLKQREPREPDRTRWRSPRYPRRSGSGGRVSVLGSGRPPTTW